MLGYFYADGNLQNAKNIRGKYVRFISIDEVLIKNVKSSLKSQHPIATMRSYTEQRRDRYRLSIGSRNLYDSLTRFALKPSKSLAVVLPKIPVQFFADFTRGFFDGDGCIHIYKVSGAHNQEVIKKLSIIFTSGSRQFLQELNRLLDRRLGLR